MNPTRSWTLGATATCTHIVVAFVHGGPVAVPDVSAYLSVAQWPYGGVLPPELAFHPGYGALLIPFGWLDGEALHTAALVFNAVLAGVCVWLAGSLARALSAPPWVCVGVCVATALHPSLSVSSRIGWPETLLTAVVLAAGLLAARERWTAFGAICGVAIAIHPRMIVATIAAIVVAVALREILRVMKGLIPGVLSSAVLLQITGSWPSARVEAAINNENVTAPLGTIAGQFLAVSGGTAGLAALGLIVGVALIGNSSANPAAVFFGISAVGVLLMGGLALAGSDRVDTLLYSRYIGPWAIPLVVVAVATASTRMISRRSIYLSLSLICLAAISVLASAHLVAGTPRTIMTLDMSALWSLADGRLVVTALAAAAISSLSLMTVRKNLIVAPILLVSLAVPSLLIAHQNLHGVGEIADGQAATSELVPDYVGCLAHDVSTKSYAMWLYRLELPDIDHRRVDITSGEQPCGPYVVAERSAFADCNGAQLVGVEPRASWGLWEYPSQGCD